MGVLSSAAEDGACSKVLLCQAVCTSAHTWLDDLRAPFSARSTMSPLQDPYRICFGTSSSVSTCNL